MSGDAYNSLPSSASENSGNTTQNPMNIFKFNGGNIPLGALPSLTGDASWQGILKDNGSYIPGKFDTLAGYGGTALQGLGIISNIMGGFEARKNMKLNREIAQKNMNLTKMTTANQLTTQEAQRNANAGMSGTEALAKAAPTVAQRMASYGLA